MRRIFRCEFVAKRFCACAVSFVFVEKSPRILEEIHILARTFKDGVCSKLAYIEKEATAFEASRSQEEKKEEKVLGTKSIQRPAGKGRVSHIGKGLKTS